MNFIVWVIIIITIIGLWQHGEASHCGQYGSHYFACINDCACGVCGQRCLSADEHGNPVSASCSKSAWSTNAHSLNCAIHDDTIGPILTALFSMILCTAIVVLVILTLQLLHKSCSCAIRQRNIDPHHVICDAWPVDT